MKPTVTIADDGNSWKIIEKEFKSRFPIRNAAFVDPVKGNQLTTVPSLDVDFKRFDPKMFPSFTPGAVQTNIFFLHIYIISVDDFEMFKNETRSKLKDWWNSVGAKKNQVQSIDLGLDCPLFAKRF